MPSRGPRMIEWYRADPWPRMRGVLLAGPAVLTSGGIVIAASFLASQSHRVRFDAAVAGFLLVAGGAIFTTVVMHHILRDDTYLALRTDGVVLRAAGKETLVGWDELLCARWDDVREQLVLERTDGASVAVASRFARATGPEICARIAQAKRRAAMNMLR